MTVILVLFTCVLFLVIDAFMPKTKNVRVPKGTTYTTPGFEMLGALAQDGGESTCESEAAETDAIMGKMERTMGVGASKN